MRHWTPTEGTFVGPSQHGMSTPVCEVRGPHTTCIPPFVRWGTPSMVHSPTGSLTGLD